jgi:hypothetical protein
MVSAKKKIKEDPRDLTRINFEVSKTLRNAFKAKVASHGKKIKDVLIDFMSEYVKKS